jgi:hypothetical protein
MTANPFMAKHPASQTLARPKQRGRFKRGLLPRLAGVWLILTLALPTYVFLIRPAHSRWGATDAEVARGLPGDALIASPTFNATRTVPVNAPPETIWPWLVQWGYGRAGFYGYDLVENIGSPIGLHAAA